MPTDRRSPAEALRQIHELLGTDLDGFDVEAFMHEMRGEDEDDDDAGLMRAFVPGRLDEIRGIYGAAVSAEVLRLVGEGHYYDNADLDAQTRWIAAALELPVGVREDALTPAHARLLVGWYGIAPDEVAYSHPEGGEALAEAIAALLRLAEVTP